MQRERQSESVKQLIWMYVCIEVTLRGDAHGPGVPTGPRGGTHQDCGSNIPTPQYQRHRVTHAGS